MIKIKMRKKEQKENQNTLLKKRKKLNIRFLSKKNEELNRYIVVRAKKKIII